jgi:hypothetical protein
MDKRCGKYLISFRSNHDFIGEIYCDGLDQEDMMEMIRFVELFPVLNLDGHHWISLVLLEKKVLDRDSTDHIN